MACKPVCKGDVEEGRAVFFSVCIQMNSSSAASPAPEHKKFSFPLSYTQAQSNQCSWVVLAGAHHLLLTGIHLQLALRCDWCGQKKRSEPCKVKLNRVMAQNRIFTSWFTSGNLPRTDTKITLVTTPKHAMMVTTGLNKSVIIILSCMDGWTIDKRANSQEPLSYTILIHRYGMGRTFKTPDSEE